MFGICLNMKITRLGSEYLCVSELYVGFGLFDGKTRLAFGIGRI